LRKAGLGIEMFTQDELRDIHYATVEVLADTGLWVEDEEAMDVFASGGCHVDRKSHTVRIPAKVLEECIRWAPQKVVLCGRDPKNDVVLEGWRVTYTNFAEGIKVIDPETFEVRPSIKQDVADLAKIVDYLDQIDVYTIAVTANDVAPESAEAHLIEATLHNTTKPICGLPLGHHGADVMIDAAAAVVGGHDKLRERPILEFLSCPVSPLKLGTEFTGCILSAAKAGIPSLVLSMAMSGASSPVTLAGTLVTHNAEVLGGIVMAQLAAPGCPCIYGSSTTAFDLRRAAATVGTPELALINAAVPALARFYELPSYVAGA
jgi:trimethylamine--corrinoid protein Co-methyltransferase